jgi:predicted XRE-type DNA-binding protein
MYSDPVPALKRQLGVEIAAGLARRLGSDRRADIAVLLDTDPARISDLRHGKLDRFSLETLIRFAARLWLRVDLSVVYEPPARRGR